MVVNAAMKGDHHQKRKRKKNQAPVEDEHSWRGLMLDTLFPAVFTSIVTVISFILMTPLSYVEVEFSDGTLVATCLVLACGPLWWLANLWLCKKHLRTDIYLVSYTSAMVSVLAPVVSLCFEAFLYFFDDDTLAIQSTLAITQAAAIYTQLHLFYEVGKISSTKGVHSTYGTGVEVSSASDTELVTFDGTY